MQTNKPKSSHQERDMLPPTGDVGTMVAAE
jgi:hypothetical protein